MTDQLAADLSRFTEPAWLSGSWRHHIERIDRALRSGPLDVPDDPVLVDAGITSADPVATERIRGRYDLHPPGPRGGPPGPTDYAHWEHLYRLIGLGWQPGGDVVVEFGGGYGNLARLAHAYASMGPIETGLWVVVDHPVMLAVQRRFLAAEDVPVAPWVPGYPLPFSSGVVLAPSGPDVLDEIASFRGALVPDVLVSTFALSETDPDAVRHVASRDWLGASAVLLALDLSKTRVFDGTQALVDAAVADGFEWSPTDWPGAVYATKGSC